MSNIHSEVSSPLRTLRLARGLSIEDLASAAGISGRTVLSAERGEHFPYPATRRCIAMALGVAQQALWPPYPDLYNGDGPAGNRTIAKTSGGALGNAAPTA